MKDLRKLGHLSERIIQSFAALVMVSICLLAAEELSKLQEVQTSIVASLLSWWQVDVQCQSRATDIGSTFIQHDHFAVVHATHTCHMRRIALQLIAVITHHALCIIVHKIRIESVQHLMPQRVGQVSIEQRWPKVGVVEGQLHICIRHNDDAAQAIEIRRGIDVVQQLWGMMIKAVEQLPHGGILTSLQLRQMAIVVQEAVQMIRIEVICHMPMP